MLGAEELFIEVIGTSKRILFPKYPFTVTSIDSIVSIHYNYEYLEITKELGIQVVERERGYLVASIGYANWHS